MAKISGLGSAFFAGIYDISGDVGSIGTIETTRAMLDVTGIDKSAVERITGRRDGTMSFNAFFNTAAAQEHVALLASGRTDLQASVFIGSTVGGPAASILGKQLTYGQTFGADGSLVTASSVAGNGNGLGVEWGEMLTTGKQSFATGTVNGTSIDLGSASTLFGAAAYIHIITMPSGTATFAVQDSTDNITFNNVAGMAFTGATGPTTQRVQGAIGATVLRYVRIQGTGVHGTSLIAVNFVRYTESSAS